MSANGDPPVASAPEYLPSERRIRTLTQKANDLYEQNKYELNEKCASVWNSLELLITESENDEGDIEALRLLENNIKSKFTTFKNKSDIYLDFLNRQNTEDANEQMSIHLEYFQRCKTVIEKIFQNIRNQKLDVVEQSVTHSSKSKKKLELEIRELDSEYKEQSVVDRSVVDRHEYTKNYVEGLETKNHESVRTPSPPRLCNVQSSPMNLPKKDMMVESVSGVYNNLNKQNYNRATSVRGDVGPYTPQRQTNMNNNSYLNPQASVFNPSNNFAMNGLSQFLLKKDLQLSRFSVFNDKPETFAAWKSSFLSIATELNLTPFEEIDLIVKHLGAESAKFAISIRSSNTYDPVKGLQQIWERLENRYGRPEMVETSLKKKLINFPKLNNKDSIKLYDLLDILCEVESVKSNPDYGTLLAYYDSSSGVTPIVNKLPHGLQEKWAFRAAKYKKDKGVPYSPFHYFVSFIREISEIKNDPALTFEASSYQPGKPQHIVYTRKQDISTFNTKTEIDVMKRCPIHRAEHSLNQCKGFQFKNIDERKQIIKEHHVCFRCCESTKHSARDCKTMVKCAHCGKTNHASAMHIARQPPPAPTNRSFYGGEQSPRKDEVNNTKCVDGGEQTPKTADHAVSKCTTLCGDDLCGKSCSKTVLLEVYHSGSPNEAVPVYAILDDHSNRSLATYELFNRLKITGETTQYTLSSCSGRVTAFGRRAADLWVRSVDGLTNMKLPSVIECDDIPNELSEIPTPNVAKAYKHLQHLADHIPEKNPNCQIQLLIGRDLPEAHHVLAQVIGNRGMPFAQKLSLGWVIVGEVCLGKVHPLEYASVKKTHIMQDGRATTMEPCQYSLNVKEGRSGLNEPSIGKAKRDFRGDSVFLKTPDDDQVGISVEDRQFLKLMDKETKRDEDGFWTAPLHFKCDVQGIPNNRMQAWRRACILDENLQKNPSKKEHFVTFMSKVLDNGAAEVCPTGDVGDCWYLPLFGVYNSKKPDQLRGVYDSSAVHQGVYLNSLLMSGPDLVNSLIGVLLRFRKDAYAITADVEQMFYRFRVHPEHRDFMRFFWYEDNNPSNPLVEYRMRVHVFGNCASPAVATYCLRKVVEKADEDVQNVVHQNFYVDDALISQPSACQATDLLKRTIAALKEGGNVRLHKIASNSTEVMSSFPSEDMGRDLKSLDISQDPLPLQRSLGISWNLKDDTFIFHIMLENKPFTRRGLLSMVNSIFDPLGFIAPITITGKILLRETTPPGIDWDAPLPDAHQKKWTEWRDCLQNLQEVTIPRMFAATSVSTASKLAIFIFSDASEKAIAAVSYIKLWDKDGNSSYGFLLGKAKLAPNKGHTIPRLELCAAVLATELAEIIKLQLDIPLTLMNFFTDSKVVLGYICNHTRRFFTYVSNRVEQILKISSSAQWSYIPTDKNPADYATRCSTSFPSINDTVWLKGPKMLESVDPEDQVPVLFPMADPENDKEVKPDVSVYKTSMTTVSTLGCERFKRFSRWRTLVRAMVYLKYVARLYKSTLETIDCKTKTVEDREDAELLILKEVQKEGFPEEISRLRANKIYKKKAALVTCHPS